MSIRTITTKRTCGFVLTRQSQGFGQDEVGVRARNLFQPDFDPTLSRRRGSCLRLDGLLVVVVVNEEMPDEMSSFATLLARSRHRKMLLWLLCSWLARWHSQHQTSKHRRCPQTYTQSVSSQSIKRPVPDRVKTSLVIFDIRALWRSTLSVRVPGCQKLQVMA